MEKAILKTLIYADLFDYPLQTYELHKWLIGKKVTLRQIEKALKKLCQSSSIKRQGQYYLLRNRDVLTAKRRHKEKQSEIYFRKAKLLSIILKIIPWVTLVGISGGLAMENAGKKDDIDLFIIAGKNRLWISRLCVLLILSLAGQRRKANESGRRIAGKFCLNTLLEEDKLEQENKDIFVAHEVLQMKVLWQRSCIYSKYLSDNEWVFKFLPNWIATGELELGIMNHESGKKQKSHNSLFIPHNSPADLIEKSAKWFQLKIMSKPQGMERMGDGFLYFHPQDCRPKILLKYKKRIKK